MFIRTILFTALLFVVIISFSQTAGISNVTSIESIANRIDVNKASIANQKKSLSELETAWKRKMQSLQEEINALYKERDAIIADMKVGARCSQCNGWKSEFEKKGENFEKHLGEVKGYAIPATTGELEATRKLYAEKIALKKVQLQNLEKGDKVVLMKKSEIAQLEKENETHCVSITAHSKSYDNVVFSEAKAKHAQWIESLMNFASAILIADDKITIANARIIKYNTEFSEESRKVREQVSKDFKDAQNNKLVSIAANEKRIIIIQTEQKEYIEPIEMQKGILISQKEKVELTLKNSTITEKEREGLEKEKQQLLLQISELDKNMLQYNATTKSKISQIELENKLLKDEIVQLAIDLPKKQEQEIAKVKVVYDKKIAAAKDQASRSSAELSNAKVSYRDKVNTYKKGNNTYVELVILESNRMLTAGQKVSCSVWNDVRGKVASNWNQLLPCVDNIATQAKPYSTNVFNSYCTGSATSASLGSYKAFLSGLAAEDILAIKNSSNATWFESITK